MHSEQFVELLTSPARLYRLPYAELESLVLEYPYAQNLRLLLFAKSWLESRPDAESLLQKASLYSTDRRALYAFVQQLSTLLLQSAQSPVVHGEEDILELRQLPLRLPLKVDSPLQQELQAKESTQQEFSPRKRKSTPEPSDPQLIRQKLEALLADSFPAQGDAQEEKTSFTHTEDFPAHVLRKKHKEEVLLPYPTAPNPGAGATPLPKSRFASWQEAEREKTFTQRLNELYQRLFSSDTPKPDACGPEMPAGAAHSVLDHEGLASETYADILVRQGDFQTAIAVYRRLILKFPEKTAFFAGQIEKLKNSIP